MLTFEQIITLSDKGFSPEQIVKLTGEEIQEPVPEPAPEPEPEENPEQNSDTPAQIQPGHEETPEQNQESGSISSVLQDAIKGFSAEVAEMRKALQASNIRTIIRDDVPPEKSADDVLAELIHPTMNKGGN